MAHKVDSCIFFVELLHFVGRETNGSRAEKVIQMVWIGRAGYRSYPCLARKHPHESELCRSDAFALRPPADELHERHIVSKSFGRELRQVPPTVSLFEAAVLVDYARKESTPQRAIGNETDARLPVGRSLMTFSKNLFCP